jgi:TolB-like protein
VNYKFDGFTLDTDLFELRKDGAPVAIEPQTLSVIRYLIDQRQRLVSREDLVKAIWGGRAVSDWAISASIKSARQALDDTASPRRYIQTVHGKGFRFIAALDSASNTVSAPAMQPTIAVLPFEDLNGEEDQRYFADGIAEDLITDLSQTPGLSVISRNAAFTAAGQGTSRTAIADRLSANHLLEGSIRHSGDALRINVRLLAAGTEEPLWAARFDGLRADIFDLQDRINDAVIRTLKLQVSDPRNSRPTLDAIAHDLCLQGRAEYYQYTPVHLAKALALFEQATDRDPGYAEAFAYQSYCRTSMHVFAWPGSDETLEPAIALAERAIALDSNSAVA